MGRGRKPIVPNGEAPKLLRRFKETKPGWQRERLLAVKRVPEEVPTLTVAEEMGRSENTI